jgi:hypothetical protein
MKLFLYPLIIIAALTAKAGTFTFFLGKIKYLVMVTAVTHTGAIGKFSLAQAVSLAVKIASGSFDGTVRIGSDDYTFVVSPTA